MSFRSAQLNFRKQSGGKFENFLFEMAMVEQTASPYKFSKEGFLEVRAGGSLCYRDPSGLGSVSTRQVTGWRRQAIGA
jgi:hypothetical protein